MSIDGEKLKLIQWILSLEEGAALDRVKRLMKNHKNLDGWDKITKEERSAIEKGLEELKAGRVKFNSQARKLYAKWL